MTSGVCVLGDTAVDLIVRLPTIRNGVKVMTRDPQLHPGGSGANTAVALARLGVRTQFIGTVGEDQYGQAVIEDFRKEKVEIDQLSVKPSLVTVCVFAFVDQDGERFLWGWPRVRQSYTSIEIENIDMERIRQAGWLHTTGLLLAKESSGRDATLKVLDWAARNGVVTSLDLNLRVSAESLDAIYQDVVGRAIAGSQYVLGSEQEFKLLHPSRHWQEAVDALVGVGKTVVVRRGEQGALLFTNEQRLEVPAFSATVVDTVGAGDVFDAGFIAARLAGESKTAALQWGNAVAGYTIQKEGVRTSPTLEQMREFISTSSVG